MNSAPLAQRLAALGFVAGANEVLRHRERRDLTARLTDRWLLLHAGGPASVGALGACGPWRSVRDDRVGGVACELPLRACLRGAADGEGDPLPACLAWARGALLNGDALGGWRAPPAEDLAGWSGDPRLTVRAGALLAQGGLLREDQRVALRFPLIARVPETLPRPRRAWLAALLTDARQRWRLARIGVVRSRRAVAAEVDLTGAPHAALDDLLAASLAALTNLVEWVLPPLGVILDPSVRSRTLDRSPSRALPAERETRHA
jgi:hypothetical protein